jgi:structure-specific endonuclease subunit SLX1
MLSTHPWSTWPLHVKLFTDGAVKGWKSANDQINMPLPLGFTCTVELEGVDGKSGQAGSGRLGPLNVDDGNVAVPLVYFSLLICAAAQFTSAHLAKNTALLASNRRLTCSICKQDVPNYSTVRVCFLQSLSVIDALKRQGSPQDDALSYNWMHCRLSYIMSFG